MSPRPTTYGPAQTLTDYRGEVWVHQFGEMYGHRSGMLRHRDRIRTEAAMARPSR